MDSKQKYIQDLAEMPYLSKSYRLELLTKQLQTEAKNQGLNCVVTFEKL